MNVISPESRTFCLEVGLRNQEDDDDDEEVAWWDLTVWDPKTKLCSRGIF